MDIGGSSQYAVGWTTLALLNAGLAQTKSHSGLVWFLISLFVGPLATLFIVAFLSKPPSEPTRAA
jgi:hypothetical protein